MTVSRPVRETHLNGVLVDNEKPHSNRLAIWGATDMNGIAAATAAAALAAVLAAPAHAVIVNNGSFENGTFAGNAQGYEDLSPGSTTITGWTVINYPLAWIGTPNTVGLTPGNGSFFLDLTSDADNGHYGGVTQTITTVMGGHYQMTFDLGGSTTYGVPDSLTACAGGSCQVSSITATTTNQWAPETLNFIAGGTSTVISLYGTTGQKYIGLDNVAVRPVPLPNSLVLLGTGLLGVAVLLRRRRRTIPQALA
jgi:hypothetical protein